MSEIIQLKNPKTGANQYPITLADNIVGPDGSTFQNLLDGKADKIAIVEQTSTTLEIQPNVFNKWGEVSELNITFANPTENDKVNLYYVQFISGQTPTNLILPSNLKWGKGCGEIKIEANTIYELNIRVNGNDLLGLWEGYV